MRVDTATVRAFTLAELLVVMAIVLLLGSLLLPVVGSALNAGRRVACAGNLRQVAAAVTAYASDHGGCLPAEGNKGVLASAVSPAWYHRLPAYADGVDARSRNSVFQCAGYTPSEPRIFDNASPKSFKMNSYLDEAPHGRGWFYRSGRWRFENSYVLFVDAVAGETGMGQWGHCYSSAVTDERHHGAVNVLYLDGHSQAAVSTPADDAGGDPDWAGALRWHPD